MFEDQFREVGDLLMADLRAGEPVTVFGVSDYAARQINPVRNKSACGAGRGTVLVDIHGDLWPCHRWNKQEESGWRIGSIYEQFNDEARKTLDVPSFIDLLENDCENCEAKLMCSGGCPAENLEETGSVYRMHDNACEVHRIMARVGRYVHEKMTSEQNEVYRLVYCSPDDAEVAIFH